MVYQVGKWRYEGHVNGTSEPWPSRQTCKFLVGVYGHWCVHDKVCSGQVARYTAGVKRFDFDAGLAPYNLSAYAAWQRLSGHMTSAVIDHLQPRPQVSILVR